MKYVNNYSLGAYTMNIIIISGSVLYKEKFLSEIKRCRDGGMKLLANKVHIQGMEVLLADKVHYPHVVVLDYALCQPAFLVCELC